VRFHHIGFAVNNIRQYLDEFFIPLFAPLTFTEPVADPIQRVTVCFAKLVGGTAIELVEPLGEDSPVKGIICSQRGGLYHLCYEVDHLAVEIERLRSKHCMLLGKPVPAAAFDGRRIVFLMTPQRDLIELVEAHLLKS
jgi:methylmalonyl-CoA/ethylmalonyl-CoA epimerase